MAFYQFEKEQFLPVGVAEVWDFISSPANLKRITPDHMGFDITSGSLPEKVYEGMIISYKVKPLFGIKMKWVTEITHVREQEYFVDEQRIGPYKMWHHEHKIAEVDNGTMMYDLVSYQPPMGSLGAIANRLFIRNSLEEIFAYREKALKEIFGF